MGQPARQEPRSHLHKASLRQAQLRRAPWPILREFPREWLKECLDAADLPPQRRAAVLFFWG